MGQISVEKSASPGSDLSGNQQPQGLDRVRQAARQDRAERFTALLHHVDLDLLRTAFFALTRGAAPGVDGVTWRDYEADLEARLRDLHVRICAEGAP